MVILNQQLKYKKTVAFEQRSFLKLGLYSPAGGTASFLNKSVVQALFGKQFLVFALLNYTTLSKNNNLIGMLYCF